MIVPNRVRMTVASLVRVTLPDAECDVRDEQARRRLLRVSDSSVGEQGVLRFSRFTAEPRKGLEFLAMQRDAYG